MTIEFTNKISTTLLNWMGTESTIADAARVSTGSLATRDAQKDSKLVTRLYNEKHGVPFESCILAFEIEVPIFISRQLVKHRLSSTNEVSGRYSQLKPKFYVPSEEENLAQTGRAMDYRREQLDPLVANSGITLMKQHYEYSWDVYQTLLREGFSNEQARSVLPTATFTKLRMTANLRSWLNFIELRVDWGEQAKKRSHPQAEIQQVGLSVAFEIQEHFPSVWKAFKANGYEAV